MTTKEMIERLRRNDKKAEMFEEYLKTVWCNLDGQDEYTAGVKMAYTSVLSAFQTLFEMGGEKDD